MLVKFANHKYIDKLIQGSIKSTFPRYFNDPFDSQLKVGEDVKFGILNRLNKIIPSGFPKLGADEVNFYISMIEATQITCLIKCNPLDFSESMLMWAHYADSGKNIALCFEDSCIQGKYSAASFDVRYTDTPISSEKTIFEYIKNWVMKKNSSTSGEKERYLQLQKEALTNFYKQKSISWGYEKEVRIVSYNSLVEACNEYNFENLTMKEAQLILQNLINENKIHDYDFVQLGVPKKIIIGYSFDESNIEQLLAKCQENKITLSKMKIPDDFTEYKFEENILYAPD